jgi:hypothetical protein
MMARAFRHVFTSALAVNFLKKRVLPVHLLA